MSLIRVYESGFVRQVIESPRRGRQRCGPLSADHQRGTLRRRIEAGHFAGDRERARSLSGGATGPADRRAYCGAAAHQCQAMAANGTSEANPNSGPTGGVRWPG